MMSEVLNKNWNTTTLIIRAFLILVIQVMASVASATCYVTFNDGHMQVFPDTCVLSLVQDQEMFTITAIDGSVYAYPLDDIVGISHDLPKALPTFTSFKFDDKYNYQLIGDATGVITEDGQINVEVAGIGKRLTASFTLSDDNAQVLVCGIEQVSKVSRNRFASPLLYTVCHRGDKILTQQSSGNYSLEPYGREYLVTVDFLTDHATSVPRIDINTVGGVNITSKIDYVDAEIIIDGAGVFPSMTDSVQIRGRGNSSWSTNPNSKNPYRLKFGSKVKPLGLTKGKNWVLLANKLKGSMLTNAIGMKAASLIGTAAVNHIIPVDLYINGTYKGSYNFTEKVGFANNSIDLDDETTAALLELDTYYDEATNQKFRSSPYSLPVNIKSPEFNEDDTQLTLALIRDRFNSFTQATQSGGDLSAHVDLDALSRFLMLNEYICNKELFHPKSIFCYNENILEDSCKFVFGPAWDFDWAFGFNGSSAGTYFVNNVATDYYTATASMNQNDFFSKLHNYTGVKQHTYELWLEFLNSGLDELCEFCQEYYDYAKPSFDNNKNAGLDAYNYTTQTSNAINWLRQRASNVCKQLQKQLFIPGDMNFDGIVNIADITSLIDYLLSGTKDITLEAIADINNDEIVNISDVTFMIDILLSGD